MKATLDRILQSQGFGTRRQCRELIESGAVSIGGAVVEDWRTERVAEGLEFVVSGCVWRYRRHVYLAMHKPAGIECSRRPSHHPGVLALLPPQLVLRGVQPVGRLDHDTTGLLLLSDDGAYIHALSHPKRHVSKTYEATTNAPATDDQIARLQAGVQLADEPLPLAAAARRLGPNAVELVIEQGKYHQVKRMIAAAGNHCVALQRSAIGQLSLASLALSPGEWRYIEPTLVR